MTFSLISETSDTFVLRISKTNLLGLFPEVVIREMTKRCLGYEGHIKERVIENLTIPDSEVKLKLKTHMKSELPFITRNAQT